MGNVLKVAPEEKVKKPKRKAISEKVRFEVFKRDSFACQYCGEAAPNVVLNVDHIKPVADGGSNELLNLITSCFSCNSGKGARPLKDDAVLRQQMTNATLLSEKREQIKMIAEWRQGLLGVLDQEVETLSSYIDKNYDILLSDYGKSEFKKTIKKFGLPDVLEAVDKSAMQYLENVEDKAQRTKFLDYIPKICYWQDRERKNPDEASLRKIAYTAQRLWYRCNPPQLARRLMELHYNQEFSVDDLWVMVKTSTGIMQFEDKVNEQLED